MWRWCKRIGLGFLVLLVVLLASGALYQFIRTKLDEEVYPPLGRMIDVGGYRLHMHSMGSGGPTVVLDAGMGNIGLDWGLVQPEIAKRVGCQIREWSSNHCRQERSYDPMAST